MDLQWKNVLLSVDDGREQKGNNSLNSVIEIYEHSDINNRIMKFKIRLEDITAIVSDLLEKDDVHF